MRGEPALFGQMFLVTLLCLVATGCGSHMNNYEKVKHGMTEAEVEAILGKGKELDLETQAKDMPGGEEFPDRDLLSDVKVVLWEEEFETVMVMFRDEKVFAKTQTSIQMPQ